MIEGWMGWTVLFVLAVCGVFKFLQKADDEWEYKNYDEHHFTGYEDPKWRK